MTAQPDGGQAQTARPEFEAMFESIADNVSRVVQGKGESIRLALCCMLAGGHLLVEDVPGVGKTSLAKALAASVKCTWQRIQFTPDLLPSDVTGVTVYRRDVERFEFRPGGVFANLVLADEINRASPKTQAALLEAMEERQVTVDGVTHALPSPFMVIATQNPVEHVGTYPLPDSQLDRFLLRIEIGYPERASEVEMLERHAVANPLETLECVVSGADVEDLVAAVRQVYVAPALRGYLVDLANATRGHPALALGASPRAILALQRAAKSWAAANGRNYVIPDDVQAMAVPVLAHRLTLAAEQGGRERSPAAVVEEIVSRLPVPVSRARH